MRGSVRGFVRFDERHKHSHVLELFLQARAVRNHAWVVPHIWPLTGVVVFVGCHLMSKRIHPSQTSNDFDFGLTLHSEADANRRLWTQNLSLNSIVDAFLAGGWVQGKQ